MNSSAQDLPIFIANTNISDNNDTLPISNTIAGQWSNYQVILTIILSLVIITTISANSLVLYLFFNARTQRLRSPTHLLLANLAVADLLVGVIVMPLLLSITVTNLTWYWGEHICFAFDYIHFALCAMSMFSVIGVVTERYIGVKYPLRHRRIMSRNRVKIFIICLWVLAITFTSVPLTIWPILEPKIEHVCFIHLRQPFVLFVSFGIYWTPVSTMMVLYWMIYRNAVKPFQGQALPFNINTVTLDIKRIKTEEQKFLKARSKQTNLTKKLSIFVAVLFLMFGPLFVVFFLKGIDSPYFSIHLLIMMGWIRYGNSTVNPFLYTFAVPGYRTEFYRIFLNEKSKSRGKGGNGSDHSAEESEDDIKMDYSEYPTTLASSSETEYRSMTKKPTLVEHHPLQNLNRSCTYCGSQLKKDDTQNSGKEAYCDECVQTLSGDQEASLSPLQNNQYGTESTITTMREPSPRPPLISEPLLFEIQNFLQVISEKNIAVEKITGDVVRNRGSQLLNNLIETFPQGGSASCQIRKNKNSTEKVQEIRKSIMVPIMERRDELISNCGDRVHSINWDIIKELDEIVALVENNIIQPLNSCDTN